MNKTSVVVLMGDTLNFWWTACDMLFRQGCAVMQTDAVDQLPLDDLSLVSGVVVHLPSSVDETLFQWILKLPESVTVVFLSSEGIEPEFPEQIKKNLGLEERRHVIFSRKVVWIQVMDFLAVTS